RGWSLVVESVSRRKVEPHAGQTISSRGVSFTTSMGLRQCGQRMCTVAPFVRPRSGRWIIVARSKLSTKKPGELRRDPFDDCQVGGHRPGGLTVGPSRADVHERVIELDAGGRFRAQDVQFSEDARPGIERNRVSPVGVGYV